MLLMCMLLLRMLLLIVCLQVCFYNSKTEEVSSHTLRLPKEGTVGDLLAELQRQLGEEHTGRPLRLLEISYSRIYKVVHGGTLVSGVMSASIAACLLVIRRLFNSVVQAPRVQVFATEEKIDQINDAYWRLRAEQVEEDEVMLDEADLLLHVVHLNPKLQVGRERMRRCNNQWELRPVIYLCSHNMQSSKLYPKKLLIYTQNDTFGEPFLLKVGPQERLSSVKERIQAKLGTSDEEFAKWKFGVVRNMRGAADPLDDDDVVASKFVGTGGEGHMGHDNYLALEHETTGRRGGSKSRTGFSTYERAIKIYG